MPGTFSNDRLVFWTGIAGSEELRRKYAETEVLNRLNAGELAGLCFEAFHTTSPLLKGISTVRTGGADRLAVKPIVVNRETFIFIIAEILGHRHDKEPALNGTNRERETRLLNQLSKLKETDFGQWGRDPIALFYARKVDNADIEDLLLNQGVTEMYYRPYAF